MLEKSPAKRITIERALKHEYFSGKTAPIIFYCNSDIGDNLEEKENPLWLKMN
jgi:hypothetical protein